MHSLKSLISIEKASFIKVLIAGFILPNIVFCIVCHLLNVDRPIINIDYLIPIVLIPLLRFRFSGLLLFILFFIVFLADVLLAILQLFPFINLLDIVYLSAFLFVGPVTYKYYFAYLTILLVIEYILIDKTVKGVNPKAFLLPFLLVVALQGVFVLFSQTKTESNHSPVKFAASGIEFFIKNHNTSFFKLNKLQPLLPTRFNNASKPWFTKLATPNSPLGHKLLLIVNESWGYPLDKKIRDMTLEKLKTSGHIEHFEEGGFPIIGATVGGELRELCELDPQLLDMSKVKEGFDHCLPNELKKQGYETIAMHGTKTLFLYNRTQWYPLAGFNKVHAAGDFNIPLDPDGVFSSAMDIDLFPVVAESFKKNPKLFYYWMTVSTHTPYEATVRNKRFSCDTFGLTTNSDSCRSLILQTQFFDGLADLIQKPEMKGVEVVVAGDHPPPITSFVEAMRVFDPSKVSWIRFKVKDDVDDNSDKVLAKDSPNEDLSH